MPDKEEKVMADIQSMLPVLIPLVILEVGLALASIIHIVKHPKYKCGNKVMWILVSFITIIGPVLYFTVGKGDE